VERWWWWSRCGCFTVQCSTLDRGDIRINAETAAEEGALEHPISQVQMAGLSLEEGANCQSSFKVRTATALFGVPVRTLIQDF
jgi:hypothetical protein